MRQHPILITLFVVGIAASAPPAFGEIGVSLITELNIDSRTGLFATSDTTDGVVSSQLNIHPGLLLVLSTGRWTFQSRYQLRLSNAVTRQDEFDLNLLQRLTVDYLLRLTRTLQWSSQLTANMGIIDFSAALREFDEQNDVTARRPDTTELRYFSIGASTGITKQLNRRMSTTIQGAYLTRRPYGYDGIAPIVSQDQFSLTTRFGLILTRKDTLDFSNVFRVVLASPGPDYIITEPRLGWNHRLNQTSSFGLRLGLMMAHQTDLYEDEDDTDGEPETVETVTEWLPRAEVTYSKRLKVTRGTFLSGTTDAGFRGAVDQTDASLQQQGRVGATGMLTFPSRWEIGARASLVTIITVREDTAAAALNQNADYPTTLVLGLTGGRRFSENIRMLAGVSSTIRWSHLWDTPVRSRGVEEVLFYITLFANKDLLD